MAREMDDKSDFKQMLTYMVAESHRVGRSATGIEMIAEACEDGSLVADTHVGPNAATQSSNDCEDGLSGTGTHVGSDTVAKLFAVKREGVWAIIKYNMWCGNPSVGVDRHEVEILIDQISSIESDDVRLETISRLYDDFHNTVQLYENANLTGRLGRIHYAVYYFTVGLGIQLTSEAYRIIEDLVLDLVLEKCPLIRHVYDITRRLRSCSAVEITGITQELSRISKEELSISDQFDASVHEAMAVVAERVEEFRSVEFNHAVNCMITVEIYRSQNAWVPDDDSAINSVCAAIIGGMRFLTKDGLLEHALRKTVDVFVCDAAKRVLNLLHLTGDCAAPTEHKRVTSERIDWVFGKILSSGSPEYVIQIHEEMFNHPKVYNALIREDIVLMSAIVHAAVSFHLNNSLVEVENDVKKSVTASVNYTLGLLHLTDELTSLPADSTL